MRCHAFPLRSVCFGLLPCRSATLLACHPTGSHFLPTHLHLTPPAASLHLGWPAQMHLKPSHTPLPLQAEGSAEASAALVHFGWAPGARAAHAMFGAVAKYGEQSGLVTGGLVLMSPAPATGLVHAPCHVKSGGKVRGAVRPRVRWVRRHAVLRKGLLVVVLVGHSRPPPADPLTACTLSLLAFPVAMCLPA